MKNRKFNRMLNLLLAGSMILNITPTMAWTIEDNNITTNSSKNITMDNLGDIRVITDNTWSVDANTKGNWTQTYGQDGYVLCGWDNRNDVNQLPYYIDSIKYITEDRAGGYVAKSGNNESGNAWWNDGIPDKNNPEGTRKIAYRFDDKRQTVRITANDNDEHQLTFYVVSESDGGRQQTVQLFEAGTKNPISAPITMTNLSEGKYITTTFKGSVDAVFNNDNYKPLNTNTLLNGIFFDTHYGEEIPVRRVSIAPVDGETIRTETGEVQMDVALYPSNATDKNINWSIQPEGTDIATVDEKGKITVHKAGTFTVRAASHDESVWNEMTMTCIEGVAIPNQVEWEILGENFVMFQNKDVRIIFDLNTGKYNVYDQATAQPYVLGAYFQVNDSKSLAGYKFNVEEITNAEEKGKTLRLIGQKFNKNSMVLDISLENEGGDILLRAGLINNSNEGVKVMQMYPMAANYRDKGGIFVGPDPAKDHAVLTGEGNWTVPKVKQNVNTTSKNNLMISYRDEPNIESFLMGQLTTYEFQSTIGTSYNPDETLVNNGRKSINADIRIFDNTGRLVDPGDTYVGDMALLNFKVKNPYDSLDLYATKQVEAMNVELMDFDPYIYECLWYVNWFTPNANQADFAVQEVKDLYTKGMANYAKPNLRVEPDTYVNPNEQLWWDDEHWKKFGHLTDTYPTMKKWVEGMQAAGGEGGTYMQASYRSNDYCDQYPEHMLYNKAEEGPDYTDPEFIEHMAEVYTNLKDTGIRSILYDYTGQYKGKSGGYLLDKTGGFEDKYATAVSAYRNIFALPKTYIGADVRITENSWEYSGSDVAIGLIDIQRNIHDTNEFNPEIAQPAINQWYRHRKTKLLYSDVKVFENKDLDLRRAQITGTAFFFGKMTLGESVNRMSDDKIKDVGRAVPFPVDGIAARPVGLFEGVYSNEGLLNPEVLDYKFNSQYDDHILLFWNQTSAAKMISADLGKDTAFGGVGLDSDKEYDIWDFWDWNYIGRLKGSEILALPIRKNEMKTMAVREVRDVPYLLSTNRHLLQGTQDIEAKDIIWNEESKSLTGTFEVVANDTFKAIIPVPEGLVANKFTVDNANVIYSDRLDAAGRYIELTLDASQNESAPFILMFEEGTIPEDTTPPSAVTGLRATADDFGIVTLTWNTSVDSSGSVRYEVYGGATTDNMSLVAITTKTNYIGGEPPIGDYYYKVVAKDAAGNVGEAAIVKTNAKAVSIAPSQLEATAGNSHNTSQAPSKVLDGNTNTIWHTNWSGTNRENMWIDLHIKNGPTPVNSLRYLPRSDQSSTGGLVKNGTIVEYRLDISRDNGKTYETLVEHGTFEGITGWQTITFEEPELLTNARLYCLKSAESENKYASAAEIRLYNAADFEGIAMRESEITLAQGENKTLIVDFYPTNYQKPVTYTSDNQNIATVDENGVVTGLAEGVAIITAKVEDKIATCTVTVKEVDGEILTIQSKDSVVQGEILDLIIGLENTAQSIYAQDFIFEYDKEAFELVSIEGKDNKTEVYSQEVEEGVRILIATDGGLLAGLSSVAVSLQVKENSSTQPIKKTITLKNIQLGAVDNGTSEVILSTDVSKELVIKPKDTETINKEALYLLIEKAKVILEKAEIGNEENQYPQEAVDRLNNAIADAELVAQNSMNQTEINEVVTELGKAIKVFEDAKVTFKASDVNGDGKVNVADLALIAYYYHVDSPEAQKADINNDKVVDIRDLTIVANKILFNN